MRTLRQFVMDQFGRPHGLLGRLAGRMMARNNRERALLVLDRLGIQPEDRILEVGFGPGLALERAAELAPRGRVVGVDHSELMWKMARKRNAASLAAGRMELFQGTIGDLPDFPSPFDKAYAINVFLFWKQPEVELRQLRAVLRPGGTVLLALQPRVKNPTRDSALAAAEKMSHALAAAGFEPSESELLATHPVETASVLARRQ